MIPTRPFSTLVCRATAAAAALTIAGLAGCASSGSGASGTGGDAGRVAGRFILTLGDADLPADVLGGGTLSERKPGARDTLTVVSLPLREPVTPSAQIEVPSSGVGYPGCIAVGPRGQKAYIVESRGAWAEGSARSVDSLPLGEQVTAVSLADPLAPRVLGTAYVGEEPRAAAVHPAGDLLAVITRNPRNQLVVVPLRADGMPGEATSWPLLGLDDDAASPSAVAWHPGGRLVAVLLADRGEVAFYSFSREADGSLAIASAGASGPGRIGRTPILGAFTPDGRHLIVLDANRSGRGLTATMPEGPGQIISIAIPAAVAAGGEAPVGWVPSALAAVAVGPAPTGMALSPDGSLAACASAQPSPAVTASTGGGALSLVRLHRDGSLDSLAEYALGAIPAGVAFDTAGRYVLVSQFGSLDPEASDGEVSFWRVLGSGGSARLEQQDFFVGIGSGPHGTLIVR